jgi:hypothetical protein
VENDSSNVVVPSMSVLLSALEKSLVAPSYEVYLAHTTFYPYRDFLSRSHLLFLKHTKDSSKLLIFDITETTFSELVSEKVNIDRLSKFLVMQIIEKENKIIVYSPIHEVPVSFDANSVVSLRQSFNAWAYRFLIHTNSEENVITISHIGTDTNDIALKITAQKTIRFHSDKWGGFSAIMTMNVNDTSKIHCVSLTISISDGQFETDNGIKTILSFQPITQDKEAQNIITWLQKFEAESTNIFSNKLPLKIHK